LSLQGKKAIILVENLYEEMELWYPYYRLKEEGVDVKIVCPNQNKLSTYKGKNGYPAAPDLSINELNLDEIDAILIPGGFAPDYLRRYDEIIELVKVAFEKNKIIAAICHGPSVLISADILKGKKATSFMAIKQDIINAGANYVDKEVVIDNNLITSRTPADLPAYCKAIIDALK